MTSNISVDNGMHWISKNYPSSLNEQRVKKLISQKNVMTKDYNVSSLNKIHLNNILLHDH